MWGSRYGTELQNGFEKEIRNSVQKVCKTWAFSFQLDEEEAWIKVVTHVVAAMRRYFTDLCLCLLYCDAKKGVYRVSQEERTKLREGVPYVKLYRYNPKHLCPKLNGY